MKISAFSGINYSNINLKPQNQEETTPIQFKVNQEVSDQGLGAKAAYNLAFLGTQASEGEESEYPSLEEFKEILFKDDRLKNDKKWRIYDTYRRDPERAWKYYNMKDNNGVPVVVTSSGMPGIYESSPEFVQELLNIKDDNGVNLFNFSHALNLSCHLENYKEGFSRMLALKDDNGEFRFTNDYHIINLAMVFQSDPELATELAKEKDELGNYKYSGSDICKIIEEMKNPPEKTSKTPDEILLDEISKIKLPSGDYFDVDSVYSKKDLLDKYKKYPEEFKKLIQLSRRDNPRISRFEASVIDEEVLNFYRHAPKTFMVLTNAEVGFVDDKKLTLPMITKFMSLLCVDKETGDVHEMAPEDLKSVVMLSKYLDNRDAEYLNRLYSTSQAPYYSVWDCEEIAKAIDIYKKYPAETVEIMRKYTQSCAGGHRVVPTEEDIQLYKNNRKEFNSRYYIYDEFKRSYEKPFNEQWVVS